jgi:hypothetical protein
LAASGRLLTMSAGIACESIPVRADGNLENGQ